MRFSDLSDLNYTAGKVTSWLINLAALSFWGTAVWFMVKFGTSQGGNPFSAFLNFFMGMVCAGIGMLVFWLHHGKEAITRAIFFWLWPETYLDQAPPVLSSMEALIRQGKFEEAGDALAEAAEKYPASSAIALFRFELYRDHLHDEKNALACAVGYFRNQCRNREETRFRLLARSADLLTACGNPAGAVQLLEQESSRSALYAPEELKNIKSRVRVLKGIRS